LEDQVLTMLRGQVGGIMLGTVVKFFWQGPMVWKK
jgi:hypothetical protein